NATQTAYPQDVCLHELFDAQVARSPEAVAVVCDDQHLTYRALHRQANQLAHHLRRLGVGPDVLVGLCVERSVELVVGLLGILKAGGAYAALDATYPRDRLRFMLEDSRPAVLLTHAHLVPSLPEHAATVVPSDAHRPRMAEETALPPESGAGPRNLAYVIYTSGSTGTPKGVLVEHRGLCNVAAAQARTFEVGEGDRVLQFSSLSFDASIF